MKIKHVNTCKHLEECLAHSKPSISVSFQYEQSSLQTALGAVEKEKNSPKEDWPAAFCLPCTVVYTFQFIINI